MFYMVERCFDVGVGIISEKKDFELNRDQCEAITVSCKAWEVLIIEAGQKVTSGTIYEKLRHNMSLVIRGAIQNLTPEDKKALFASDDLDPFGRSIFDQALDARILELERRFGEKRPSILDYTSDRLYWLKYKELVAKHENLN